MRRMRSGLTGQGWYLAGCIRQALLLRVSRPTPQWHGPTPNAAQGVPGSPGQEHPGAAPYRRHLLRPLFEPFNFKFNLVKWSHDGQWAATEAARVCRGSTAVLLAPAFPYLISWG